LLALQARAAAPQAESKETADRINSQIQQRVDSISRANSLPPAAAK
jgi:hypothetical protein